MSVHRFFFYLNCILLTGGCQLISPGIDRIADGLVNQATEYCTWKYSRRLAFYILLNGELDPLGHTLTMECKGDAEIEAQLAVLAEIEEMEAEDFSE